MPFCQNQFGKVRKEVLAQRKQPLESGLIQFTHSHLVSHNAFNGLWAGQYRQHIKELIVLTESSVEKSFRSLLSSSPFEEATFEKAEEMLDELRPESPLRHRLSQELDELRELAEAKK